MIGSLSERMNSIQELNELIKDEIDKCDVLCINCHIYEHTDIKFFNDNKEEIYDKVKNYKELQGKIDRELVKEMYENGKKQIEIARYFGASKGTISGIIKEIRNGTQVA